MNEILYIESKTGLLAKITAYDAIITALSAQALIAGGDSNIEEYSLDDGQVKIKTLYRDAMSIAKAILQFEQLRGRALAKLQGPVFILKSQRGLS